ncbi:hypothetical protein Peur_046478 [Populus x canadensis]
MRRSSHKLGIAIIGGGVTPRCPTAHRIRQDSSPNLNFQLIHSEGFCCRQAHVQLDKLLLKPVSSLTIEVSVLLPRFLVASEPRAFAGRRLCCYKDHWCILELQLILERSSLVLSIDRRKGCFVCHSFRLREMQPRTMSVKPHGFAV